MTEEKKIKKTIKAASKKETAKAPAKKEVIKKVEKPQLKKDNSFAVIETGGKQYIVSAGDKIKIEKIEKPAKGTTVVFDKVLLVAEGKDVKIGTPYLDGVKIKAEWISEGRAKKVTVIKYKPKTREATKKGHRQHYTEVLIK